MEVINFKVTEFVKKVTANLNRQLMKHEINDLTQLLRELGSKHLDGFALMLLYLPPKSVDVPGEAYVSDPSNLIVELNISHSWFFKNLEDYVKNIKDIDSKTLFNERLKIVIKAIKIFAITFSDDHESFLFPHLKKKEILETIHNEIINTLYIHSQDLDLDSVNLMFKRLYEPLSSSRITKDSSAILKMINSIKKEEEERIINKLVEELARGALIPENTKELFKTVLKFRGRVETPIVWNYKDWQLYWLIYFFKETLLIEFIPGDDINDYIIANFKPNQKGQYVRKNLITHSSRSKLKIEGRNQCYYFDYYRSLKENFTTFNLT